MEAIAASGSGEIAAIADESDEALSRAIESAGGIARGSALNRVADPVAARSLDELLELELDGIVIATPSALHAREAKAALDRGIAVFCQKPLARTRAETAGIVAAARAADRLLGVDLSYRQTFAMQRIRELVSRGDLGDIFALDLVFHNAYGPGKAWFRDPALSGGGCVIDLGVHLVDLALWTLGFPRVDGVSSRLFAQGKPLPVPLSGPSVCEDFALAQIDLEGGAVARLACSWNLAAGRDAVIEASFRGTRGGAALRNVGGSFYDFVADRYDGTRATRLAEPPDDWSGRAAVAWARRLAVDPGFDAEIENAIHVAAVLDAIYGR
jgi:predicted dehydrogenase